MSLIQVQGILLYLAQVFVNTYDTGFTIIARFPKQS
jgi:hypothetical protein